MNRTTSALLALAAGLSASVGTPFRGPRPYAPLDDNPAPKRARQTDAQRASALQAAETKRQRKAAKARRDAERREAGMSRDWNRCPVCAQLVDADDVFDGSEVVCHGCDLRLVVSLFGECTWALVLAEDDEIVEDES